MFAPRSPDFSSEIRAEQFGRAGALVSPRGLADLDRSRLWLEEDAFLRYISEQVNPARAAEGLQPVTKTHARVIFHLVVEWDKRLRGLPHALDA